MTSGVELLSEGTGGPALKSYCPGTEVELGKGHKREMPPWALWNDLSTVTGEFP